MKRNKVSGEPNRKRKNLFLSVFLSRILAMTLFFHQICFTFTFIAFLTCVFFRELLIFARNGHKILTHFFVFDLDDFCLFWFNHNFYKI